MVHAALDRLAFLLDPDGVKIHWLTDGRDDRTNLSPANLNDEPANHRGPDKLPLKAQVWNKLKVALAGDVVTLTLNGVEIYQRKLESTNQRWFGLFHYADETEVRVRHITHRGAWPKTPSTDAEFASALEPGR